MALDREIRSRSDFKLNHKPLSQGHAFKTEEGVGYVANPFFLSVLATS
jgi:hypothetical protein